MIGKTYDADTWNCTHEVAEWYSLNGFSQPMLSVSKKEWDSKFVRWMCKNFTPIDKLEQGALVVMRNKHVGGLHIGVWDTGMVHHCYQPLTGGAGQSIRSPLHMVKLNHIIIRYGRYNV